MCFDSRIQRAAKGSIKFKGGVLMFLYLFFVYIAGLLVYMLGAFAKIFMSVILMGLSFLFNSNNDKK